MSGKNNRVDAWQALNESYLQTLSRLSITRTASLLLVHIGWQRMSEWQGGCYLAEHACSTSRKPPSCLKDSLGTPWGLHTVAEKIGAGQAEGTVFKGRIPVGNYHDWRPEQQADNLITSRILWLKGLEPGVNSGGPVDTYQRYVYIHGTNQEARLGHPNSHGCVLLGNQTVIDLFDAVETGAHVYIGGV
jgi:hypothetical protein